MRHLSPRTFRTTLSAAAALAAAAAMAAGAGTPAAQAAQAKAASPAALPALSHVVIVMEENHSYNEIIGSSSAPYINSLASSGALMTDSFAISHPSEPNYMAIFAGSTFGLTGDNCPVNKTTKANLGNELLAKADTFIGYSEGLPSAGSTVCTSGEYARKHAPWVNFSSIPKADNQPFTAFPTDFTKLPTVSVIDPNLLDDMHDGTIAQGDTWLKTHMAAYIAWAKANNSILIVTWDEDDGSQGNKIATIVVGAHVATGKYTEKINHYNVLRTVEDLYGLAHAGASATATPITDIWN